MYGERFGRQGKGIFTWLDQNWFMAGLEKSLNRQVCLVRASALGLAGCGMQRLYYGATGNPLGARATR